MVESISFRVNINKLEDEAKSLVNKIRTTWKRDDMRVKVFTDGITNTLVGVHIGDASETVMVRVYGEATELLIDRNAEKRNIVTLNKAGLSPPLFAEFTNGISYGFAVGECVTADSVRDEKIKGLIADSMAKMHAVVNLDDKERKPCLFIKLRRYLQLVPEVGELQDEERNARLKSETPSKDELKKEVDELERELLKLDSPVVFCHNDLLLNNIVYNKAEDSVTFIDYEYGDYNYQAHDLGNHFAEYAGVDEVDFDRYPNKTYQLTWLRHYLERFHGYKSSGQGDSSSVQQVSDLDVEVLYVQVNKFALAAHLFWGIWALIQQKNSKIDFDFLGYGILKLNEYKRRKNDFLSLKVPGK